MKRKILAGTTSVAEPVFIRDTTSTTGGGLSGLVFNTASLVAEYRRQGQSSWTAITLVTMTLGTWVSGGFIADGSLSGAYEIGIPNAAVASGARWVQVRLRGAANMLPILLFYELDAVDYQNATTFGLTNLDAAISSRSTFAAGQNVGVATSVSGAVGSVTGNVGGNVVGSVGSVTGLTASNLDATVSSRSTYAGGAVASVTAGVTVATNNDKAGYALTSGERTSITAAIWGAATASFTADGTFAMMLSDARTYALSATTRIGAFTGTGVNTVLGFLRAMMRKTAALTPSDVGGTYDNTTDSLEAMGDLVQFLPDTTAGSDGGLPIVDGSGNVGAIVQDYATDQDPASYILASPAQKLATDASGRVTTGTIVAGAITSSVLADGAITAAKIATAAIDADALAADAVTAIQNGLMTSAGYTAPNNAGIASTLTKVTTIEGDYQQRGEEVTLPDPAPDGYGGGSAPTVEEIATRLLTTPANKLLTNASGHVTSTNGGGGGGGGSLIKP